MGERLHDYDIDLTDYAIGNVVQYLTDRRFARWVARHIKTPSLIDYLRQRSDRNVDAEQVRALFSDAEMTMLALAFEDGPPGGPWHWTPYDELHRRHMGTITEVRDGLSRPVAEEWSADCVEFARRLEAVDLSLHDGIEIIREWVHRLRALQLAMGTVQYVPAADVPKWSLPAAKPPAEGTTVGNKRAAKIEDDIRRMREAISKLGAKATPKALVKAAKIKNENGRKSLRSLEERGEYEGFAHPANRLGSGP